jgi:hypothetical protein
MSPMRHSSFLIQSLLTKFLPEPPGNWELLRAARWHVSCRVVKIFTPWIQQCDSSLANTPKPAVLHFSNTRPYLTRQNICRGIKIALMSTRCVGSPHRRRRSLGGVSSIPSLDPPSMSMLDRVLFTWWLPFILEWPRCLCAHRGGSRRALLRFITISGFWLSPWILIEERKMYLVFVRKSPCHQVQH